MDDDFGFEIDEHLGEIEGDLVEEGDKTVGVGRSILEKTGTGLSAATEQIRREVLPGHLQNKFRTVVCRWWLTGACMKGEKCEFLHQVIKDRMPDCRVGIRCPNKDNGKCQFKHPTGAELLCAHYAQGFCPLGKACRSEHLAKPLSELPLLGEFDKGTVTNRPPQSGKEWYALDNELLKRREAGPNHLFKTQVCKQFMETGGPDRGGVCPYSDDCHFAHGPADLKPPELARQRFFNRNNAGGGAAGAGDSRALLGPMPRDFALRDDAEPYRLFMLRANSIMNLARSLKQRVWRVRKELCAALNEAFFSGAKVLLLFSTKDTNQVQGCATMLSPIPAHTFATPAPETGGSAGAGGGDEDTATLAAAAKAAAAAAAGGCGEEAKASGEDAPPEGTLATVLSSGGGGADDEDEDPEALFGGHFGVSWDRGEGCMRECGLEQIEDLRNPLQYGVPCSLAPDGQEISATPEVGGRLLRRLWTSAEPELEDDEYMGTTALDLEEEGRCPRDGGFVFRTPNKSTAGESIEKGLAGCGADKELECAFVTHGTPVFLLNAATACLVFGVLVADSEYPALLDPGAFATAVGLAPGAPSPFPCQVKFKVALSCKPLRCDDPELLHALGRSEPLGEGALTTPEASRVVELLARRQYLAHVAAAAKIIAGQLTAPAPAVSAAAPAPGAPGAGGPPLPMPGPLRPHVPGGLPPPPPPPPSAQGGGQQQQLLPPPGGRAGRLGPPVLAGPPGSGPPPLDGGGGTPPTPNPASAALMLPAPWWRMDRPGRFFQVVLLGFDGGGGGCDPAALLGAGLGRLAARVGGGCSLRLRGGMAAAAAGKGPPHPEGLEPLQLVVGADEEPAIGRALAEARPLLEQTWRQLKTAKGLSPDVPLPCLTPTAASSAAEGQGPPPLVPPLPPSSAPAAPASAAEQPAAPEPSPADTAPPAAAPAPSPRLAPSDPRGKRQRT